MTGPALCASAGPWGVALQSWGPEAALRFILRGRAKRFWEEAGDSELAGRTPAPGPRTAGFSPQTVFPYWGSAGLCRRRLRSGVGTASSVGTCGVSPGVAPQRTALPARDTVRPGPSSPRLPDVPWTSSGGRARASVSTIHGNFTYFPPGSRRSRKISHVLRVAQGQRLLLQKPLHG